MKTINLRNYQEKALKELGTTGNQLLSICPGGGKTFTALSYIDRNFKGKKVLILTHGTNLLKSQWVEELNNLDIKHSTDITSKDKIIVTIPQALKNKAVPKFDLVVVDEAHEFYFAEKMVKSILEKSQPKCTLLLTGTPSRFIKQGGFKPVIIPGVEVYSAGHLMDTYFGVVKSSYKLKMDSFNDDGDTKKEVKFQDSDTQRSLNELVKEMLSRLKSVGALKDKPDAINAIKIAKLNKFQEAFGTLGKTLLAARNIQQANALYNGLLSNGVKVVLSDSESDRDSEKVEEFIKNKEIQVLIVVRRGILGFNMTDLVNVVDFTMSRNIDRIYQLYARVLRKHDGVNRKFFFRMCSALNPEVDTYFLQAAMCLNSLSFISQYNGKNLNAMEVLVPTVKRTNSGSGTGTSKNQNKSVPVDKIMAEQVLSLEMLQELTINSNSKYWKEFGYMKFGKVIEKLTGKKFHREIKNITEENLLWMIKHGKVDERIYG